MKLQILLSAIFLLILSSCKKDADSNTNCDKTVANIAGAYDLVKLEAGISGVFVDVTSQLEPCQLDDKLTLNTDGTTVYQDLGLACSPSGNATGTWSISPAGKMSIDDGSSTDISAADISSFDCSTLILTAYEPGSTTNQVRLTVKK